MKRACIAILSILIIIGGMHIYNYAVFQFADSLPFKFENYFWDMNKEGDSPAIEKRLKKICVEAKKISDFDAALVAGAGMKKTNLQRGRSVGYARTLTHWRRLGTFHPSFWVTRPSVSVYFNDDGSVRGCVYAYDAAVTAVILKGFND